MLVVIMKFTVLIFALILSGMQVSFAQHTVRFKVMDAESSSVLPGVNVLLIGSTTGAVSNVEGIVELRNVIAGQQRFRISLVGYERVVITLKVPEETASIIDVNLEHHHEELEDVTIYAARGSRLIERVPTRAEVIAGEELEEKANMNSSNISMILRETPGVQVQQTDPSTANMSFRIQGLNGRYTQLLQDGLPMYGGISSSLSIVQIPPLNLKQVEIIKGSSSTLYGGGAIAGLVNLVTKTVEDAGTTVMLNGLSTVGGDVNIFSSGKVGGIGYTAYVSGVAQKSYDVNNDGFAEVPKTNRIHAEPTIWLPIGSTATLRTGIGYTRDKREGGFQNMDGIPELFSVNYYRSKTETNRFKAIADLEITTRSNSTVQFRNVLSTTDIESNDNQSHLLVNKQTQVFSELSNSFGENASSFIIGASYLYSKTSSTYINRPVLDGVVGGALGFFGQYTVKPIDWVTIESGLRLEVISSNSLVVLPRLNVLANWNPKLTSRVGLGTGYKSAQSMFSEANEWILLTNHISSYLPLTFDDNSIERSLGLTADLDYRSLIGDELGFSINQLFFLTRINDPFQLRYRTPRTTNVMIPEFPTTVVELEITNRDGYTRTTGLETNVKWTYRNLKWYQFYTYTNISEVELGSDLPVLLTPKHRLGSVIMLEEHDSFRIGFETYATGSQKLSSGEKTDPYVILGLMAEKTWNKLSVFINFENFTDTRMKEIHPIWSGSMAHPNLNTELYAPIDGRVINGGIKFRF